MTKTDVTTATADADSATEAKAGVTEETPIAKAEWTIMIYQAGDNDLANDSIRALTDLRGVNTADKIHVVAQFDPRDPRMSTRRVVINLKDKKNKGVTSVARTPAVGGQLSGDSVKVVPGRKRFTDETRNEEPQGDAQALRRTEPLETDTSDPETLFDFISWTQQEFPADHYMLVLAGHSAGVESGFLLKDENPSRSMSFTELMRALKAVKERLDITWEILGMDACLMNMIEICYEFRGLAKILVGAQGLVPGPGWPYIRMVKALAEATPALEAEAFAPEIIKQYIDFYLENSVIGGLSVDLSALRVDEAATVTQKINDLAVALEAALDNTASQNNIILSHWKAQSYNGELFVDIQDLCDLLIEQFRTGDVPKRCEEVKTAIKGLVLESCFCGIDYQYSNGVSIYFPWSEIFAGYQDLAFSRNVDAKEITGWSKFLSSYIEKTRRPARAASGVRLLSSFRQDPPWRKDPPYHGPSGNIHSMRNPPRDYPETGVRKCIVGKERGEKLSSLLNQFKIT